MFTMKQLQHDASEYGYRVMLADDVTYDLYDKTGHRCAVNQTSNEMSTVLFGISIAMETLERIERKTHLDSDNR